MNKKSTILCGEQLLSLDTPVVMGILNVTDDSFYAASRSNSADAIAARVHQILSTGGTVVDVGAYSTRPGAAEVTEQEEIERLCFAMQIIRAQFPAAIVSIDTFRSRAVREIVARFGSVIVNDISGGELDSLMFKTVAELGLPYILTHSRGTPQTMQELTEYFDLMGEITYFFSERMDKLRYLGVSDVIIDPGFGFAKTREQNFEILEYLDEFLFLGLPVLVGVSRKSMICKTLQCTPEDALNGTTVLNTIALQKGADILRVHDVRPAAEAIRLVAATHDFN